MADFLLIPFCIAAGIAARRLGLTPPDGHRAVNAWVIYIGLPAFIIRYMSCVRWSLELLVPCLGPILVWLLALLFVRLYAALRPVDQATRAVLYVACGLSNTGFFGYPMVMAFYGAEGMSAAVVYDLFNNTLMNIFAPLIIIRAADGGGRGPGWRVLLRRVFALPPFPVSLAVLALSPVLDFSRLFPFIDLLAPTVVPLALFSIGLQVSLKDLGGNREYVLAIGLYRLALAPLAMLALAALLGGQGRTGMVSVFQAGAPAHMISCIMASQYNLNPGLCALVVPATIAGALISLPLWSLILPFFL